jgi:hypothetical protein
MEKKEGKTYVVPLNKDVIPCIKNDKVIPDAYGPNHTVRLIDVPACIVILRILSLFIKTHRYPAFKDEEDASNIEYAETTKHGISDDASIEQDSRGKATVLELDGVILPAFKKPSLLGGSEVILRTAKPRTETTPTWGLPTQIPQTHGFHFPYVKELSKADKTTVPRVLSRFFVACFSDTVESSMKLLGDTVESWNAKIAGTPWGQEISHLSRVIELAIPAQASVFPIVDNGRYLGCFMSGGQVSISHKKELFRPNSYKDCLSEIECYMSKDTVINGVMKILASPKNEPKLRGALSKSIRDFGTTYLALFVTPPDETKAQYSKELMKYRQTPYFAPSYVNFRTALEYLSNDQPIPAEWPIHPPVALSKDRFEQVLGVFGPYVPSPIIPGCRTVKLSEEVSEKSTGSIVLCLTTLHQAISDLRDCAMKRTILNFASNLSARFEHVTVGGAEYRKEFLPVLTKYADAVGPKLMTTEGVGGATLMENEEKSRQSHVTDDLLGLIGEF